MVEIEGFTKNIPLERRYIWITVDVKDLGLCWPKRQIYKLNEPFKTKFIENGPNKNFVVSPYAVNWKFHNDILKWFEEARLTHTEAGFPIMPESFKLDEVKLGLEGR